MLQSKKALQRKSEIKEKQYLVGFTPELMACWVAGEIRPLTLLWGERALTSLKDKHFNVRAGIDKDAGQTCTFKKFFRETQTSCHPPKKVYNFPTKYLKKNFHKNYVWSLLKICTLSPMLYINWLKILKVFNY
jgi:hypothetical protein